MMSTVRKFFLSQLGIWCLVAVAGVYFLATIRNNINFGIDLVGGTYITLKVDTRHVIEQELHIYLKNMRELAGSVSVNVQDSLVDAAAGQATVTCADAMQASLLSRSYIEKYPAHRTGMVSVQQNKVVIALPMAQMDELAHAAVLKNVEVLRTRLNKSDVGEVSVIAAGRDRIVIELPNVHDPEAAKQMIGKAALLEIKKVHKWGERREEIPDSLVTADKMIVTSSPERGRIMYYLVSRVPDLTGSSLRSATAELDRELYTPVIVFGLNADGAARFYELTKNNIGNMIAVILDGEVLTAPRVNQAISDSGKITGFADNNEANKIAFLLQTGSFTAPVSYLEERHIGPSLGEESIYQGLISCLAGFMILFAFALYMYRLPGLFAFIALVFNLLLTLFALAFMRATLTLPGIAGLVLSIGMAIDASILIYERIKEELAKGTALKAAIQLGFAGAKTVILDANITHFIVSIVLYYLGTGPVRGFAVTMLVGIVATLLTGVVFLRAMFDFCTQVLGVQKMRF